MRSCPVTLNNDGSVTLSHVHEYIEEHGATQLVITLSDELKAEGIAYYTLCFKPGAALKNPPNIKVTSDMITADDGVISYPLPAALTGFGSLDVQVQAHITDENEALVSLIKSPVFRLSFEPSVTGDEEVLLGDADGFIATIHAALAQLNLTIDEADALCDKINEAYENGELNGPVMMPNVSEDGTLSWSNDAGFENPPAVNIKGPQGERGDAGTAATINGYPAITLDAGGNLQLTQQESNITLSVESVPVYHTLPEESKYGSICLYSPANTVTAEHSGKQICFDWDAFNAAITPESYFDMFMYKGFEEVCSIHAAVNFTDDLTYIERILMIYQGDKEWYISFVNGVFNADISYLSIGGQSQPLNEPLTYFVLPEFDSVSIDHCDVQGDIFYTTPKAMVFCGEWTELKHTYAHTHQNLKTLASLKRDDLESDIIITSTASNYLSCGGSYLRYCSDGSVISSTEAVEENGKSYLRLWLDHGPLSLGNRPDFIDIPIIESTEKEAVNSSGLTLNGTGLDFGTDVFVPMQKAALTADETNTLSANIAYNFGECSALNITFTDGDENAVNEYLFTFVSGTTPTTLTLPASVKWGNGNELTVEANKRYEISIVDDIALWCSVDIEVSA